MNGEVAAFGAMLDGPQDGVPQPHSAEGGTTKDGLYASIMAKEANVLELVRRLDETNREQALKTSDKVAPLLKAFAQGASRFLARLMHYLSVGAFDQATSLIVSPDGMVYSGAILITMSLLLTFIM